MVDLVAHLRTRGVSGVTGMRDTGSETDRTVLVDAASGPVVLKLSDSAHMQAALLQAVAASDPTVPVPRVLPDGDGSAVSATDAGDLFVMTTVPGIPLEDVELWPALVDDLADVQAALVTALSAVPSASAQVPGENDWSIEAVTRHEHLVDDVADERHRAGMHDTVAHYRDALAPVLADLPRQVLHADANLSNVLVADGRVSGVIDFGDAVEAPRVLDVAVTACYLAIALGSFDHPLVERYTARIASALALSPAEESVVLPLAACRLVQAVVLARDTARREPDRADYVLRYDRAAVALLDAPNARPARPVHLTSEGA
ncbi:phosphotransferase [Curtobacterium sp. VKM Ac-2865]|uniref:phosphotransferase enzyme family protein n=1 Tax=Curtobacterium sp. VKM Ac-2865 TaxID=2783817 RepID=UPI00188A1320|nr:phosphotransferase [Curtobacterium sp. VKM Ac-2865]MBF4582816.1 phosphotransferase [Curtobacterium sp. VKM Ac-2865]